MVNKKNGFAVALGRLIKQRRQALKLTQEELASRLGVEFNSISRIECGTHMPSLERLEQLSHALGVSVASLLGEISSNCHDQAQVLQNCLEGLSSEERSLVLSVAKQLSEFFKTHRGKSKK